MKTTKVIVSQSGSWAEQSLLNVDINKFVDDHDYFVGQLNAISFGLPTSDYICPWDNDDVLGEGIALYKTYKSDVKKLLKAAEILGWKYLKWKTEPCYTLSKDNGSEIQLEVNESDAIVRFIYTPDEGYVLNFNSELEDIQERVRDNIFKPLYGEYEIPVITDEGVKTEKLIMSRFDNVDTTDITKQIITDAWNKLIDIFNKLPMEKQMELFHEKRISLSDNDELVFQGTFDEIGEALSNVLN